MISPRYFEEAWIREQATVLKARDLRTLEKNIPACAGKGMNASRLSQSGERPAETAVTHSRGPGSPSIFSDTRRRIRILRLPCPRILDRGM